MDSRRGQVLVEEAGWSGLLVYTLLCLCASGGCYDDALPGYECWVQLRGEGERAVAAEEV